MTRSDLWTHAILVAVVAFAFAPLLLHPTEIVWDGTSDLVHGHLPYRILMSDSLRRGDGLPAYNPTAFGGIPLTADPQAGLTYPPNWLHALSPDGGAVWFGWLMVFHCLVAGIATLWWLKGLGFESGARVAGAIALVLAGKWFHSSMASGHMGMLPLAWVPWQLGLIDRICMQPRTRDATWFAAATALVILGSHPQILLYSQCIVVVYAAVVWLSSGSTVRVHSAVLLAAGGCLALGLSARYLLPILDEVEIFVRGAAVPYLFTVAGAIEPQQLVDAILFHGTEYKRSNHVIFVGSASIAIAFFAPLHARRRAVSISFMIVLALLVAYALGTKGGVHRVAHDWLPGFSLFRLPSRALLVSGVPIAFLVAAGLAALVASRRGWAARGLSAALLLLGIGLVVSKPTVAIAWAAVGLAMPAAIVFPWSNRLRENSIWLGVAIVALQGLRFAAPLVQTEPADVALPANPIAESLRQPIGVGRVLSISPALGWVTLVRAHHATRNHLESLTGYNPLDPIATRDLMRSAMRMTGPRRWFAPGIRVRRIANRTPLDLLNVQWIVSPRPIDREGLTLQRSYGTTGPLRPSASNGLLDDTEQYVYENNRRMPRVALVRRARLVPDAKTALAAISQRDPRRVVFVEDDRLVGDFPGSFEAVPATREGDGLELDVDAGVGGYLVISEIAHPGWRAWVDDRETNLSRANGYFLMLKLDGGQHHVELLYRPRSLQVGAAVTWASLLGVIGLLIWTRDAASARAG